MDCWPDCRFNQRGERGFALISTPAAWLAALVKIGHLGNIRENVSPTESPALPGMGVGCVKVTRPGIVGSEAKSVDSSKALFRFALFLQD